MHEQRHHDTTRMRAAACALPRCVHVASVARVACVACVVCVVGVACTLPGVVKPLPPVQPSKVFYMPDRPVCDGSLGAPVEAGAIGNDKLVELSGLVASPSHKGVLWAHNDSGDK